MIHSVAFTTLCRVFAIGGNADAKPDTNIANQDALKSAVVQASENGMGQTNFLEPH